MIKRYRLIIGWALLTGFALAFMGCAQMKGTTYCGANAIGVQFALQGSTIGNQAIAAGMAAGGLGAKAPDTSTPETQIAFSYDYFPVFGADTGQWVCVYPAAPTTTNNFMGPVTMQNPATLH